MWSYILKWTNNFNFNRYFSLWGNETAMFTSFLQETVIQLMVNSNEKCEQSKIISRVICTFSFAGLRMSFNVMADAGLDYNNAYFRMHWNHFYWLCFAIQHGIFSLVLLWYYTVNPCLVAICPTYHSCCKLLVLALTCWTINHQIFFLNITKIIRIYTFLINFQQDWLVKGFKCHKGFYMVKNVYC